MTQLRLQPFAPQHLLAMREGVSEFQAVSGLSAADGLREFLVSDEVSPVWIERLRAATTSDPWLYGFAVLDPDGKSAIGMAGFKGPPDNDGVVEIAYAIAPPHQGLGYATEAAAALVTYASADDRVRTIRAHTLPTPNASTRVLTKCGFAFVGEHVDPEDGLVWRWERGKDT